MDTNALRGWIVLGILAAFSNPSSYDNGADLRELLQAQGQFNWLLCIGIGCLMFIAFSTRFRK